MFDSAHANRRASFAVRIATTALTIALVVASTTIASAQGGNAGATNKKALVGSWLETVTFPPESGRPPLKSVVSFHGDETMVASDQGGVTLEPPSVLSSGHGVWRQLKKRTFAYSVLYFDLGPDWKFGGIPQSTGRLYRPSVRERVQRYLLCAGSRSRWQRPFFS
jgi:hypothetical protein